MNIKLVNDRNQSLKVSDMRIGEVFSVVGRIGPYMRIDHNPGCFDIEVRGGTDYTTIWVIALNNNCDHTFGCLSRDYIVSTVHGMLSVDLN